VAKIIFEKTDKSIYANQGSAPSGLPGYNIWAEYPDDDMVVFLGFCKEEDAAEHMLYYLGSAKNEDEIIFPSENP
jgi:hypothetical protein